MRKFSSKESACNADDIVLISAWGRSPWRRAWQPTPVFLPGEFQGQRSVKGYGPLGHRVEHDHRINGHCIGSPPLRTNHTMSIILLFLSFM